MMRKQFITYYGNIQKVPRLLTELVRVCKSKETRIDFDNKTLIFLWLDGVKSKEFNTVLILFKNKTKHIQKEMSKNQLTVMPL